MRRLSVCVDGFSVCVERLLIFGGRILNGDGRGLSDGLPYDLFSALHPNALRGDRNLLYLRPMNCVFMYPDVFRPKVSSCSQLHPIVARNALRTLSASLISACSFSLLFLFFLSFSCLVSFSYSPLPLLRLSLSVPTSPTARLCFLFSDCHLSVTYPSSTGPFCPPPLFDCLSVVWPLGWEGERRAVPVLCPLIYSSLCIFRPK